MAEDESRAATTDEGLLAVGDPPPTSIHNPQAASPFLLTGDHAGAAIPERLGTLGLDAAMLRRHIAIDIGVEALGLLLATRLDATFVRQHYSRLVIDCNRAPDRPDAIPTVSDHVAIPANLAPDRAARIAAIHAPYHTAIAGLIAKRARTILIALHSFTPVMDGVARPWHVGILQDRGETGFARRLLAALDRRGNLVVGDNEPYRMDATDYSVPRHAYSLGLPYAEIEVRQDLLADPAGQRRWAAILGDALEAALAG